MCPTLHHFFLQVITSLSHKYIVKPYYFTALSQLQAFFHVLVTPPLARTGQTKLIVPQKLLSLLGLLQLGNILRLVS